MSGGILSRPIVVGIDPGTTAGVAVLDLDGQLLATASGRGWERSELALFAHSFGEPVLVGTDMSPVPKGVGRVASVFACRVVKPTRGLRKQEKEQLTLPYAGPRGRKPWHNAHERDALAAALHALASYRPLLQRIHKKAIALGAEALEDDVRTLVLRERTNITNTIRELRYR